MASAAADCAEFDGALRVWIFHLETMWRRGLFRSFGEAISSHCIRFALKLAPDVDVSEVVESVKGPAIID